MKQRAEIRNDAQESIDMSNNPQPPTRPDPDGALLLPARMVNEYVYCPRLAYLMWVQQEWAESADTVSGRHLHRKVDGPPKEKRDEEQRLIHARSITLGSERLGVIARLDLVEADGEQATPVEYKRGKRPHVAKGAWEPEQVQLCLQGLLLEEHGYRSEGGEIYFHGSHERVSIAFDDELRQKTQAAICGLRALADGGQIPPPLEESPRCNGCSLVGICLPDEVQFLRGRDQEPPRPLAVAASTALPLYVQAHHAKVAKKGERIEVEIDDQPAHSVPIGDISQLVLHGNVYVTTPCMQTLMEREIPISWHSHGGWFYGHSIGTGHKNVELRTAQYRASFDPERCLAIARALVRDKILNSRTLLRRNWRNEQRPEEDIAELKHQARQAKQARDLQSLLGIEGAAAARYFRRFDGLLKNGPEDAFEFHFERRNRRPPKDPVNALLSFAYAMLVRSFTQTLSAIGFDPYRGYYHQPRYGRPALALDLMEPFRPLIADSAVLTVINNGEIKGNDFIRVGGAVNLKEPARKAFIAAFERRLSQEITHPQFGYSLSYRRLLELQARLLGRYLLGEFDQPPAFITR
jgi:CRISPR-associated endonuclease Cas1/CRISPR-associated protein Cas4